MNNPDFNIIESDYIKNESGGNTFTLSVKNWTERTNAIGIISKPGRYGGTFAHSTLSSRNLIECSEIKYPGPSSYCQGGQVCWHLGMKSIINSKFHYFEKLFLANAKKCVYLAWLNGDKHIKSKD